MARPAAGPKGLGSRECPLLSTIARRAIRWAPGPTMQGLPGAEVARIYKVTEDLVRARRV